MRSATCKQLFETIDPLLVFAREAWQTGREKETRNAITACRVYLGLYGPPRYVNYNPAAFIKMRAERLTDNARHVNVEPVANCVGDPVQTFDCLRQLVFGAVLHEDSALVTEVFDAGDVLRVTLSFDGPGQFPREVAVEGLLPLSVEELGQRWTLATRGGRIDTAPNGLQLRLTGMRMPPEPVRDVVPVLEAVERAAALSASGHGRVVEALDRCLVLVEGEEHSEEPVGLKALLGEVMDDFGPELAAHAIAAETLVDPATPPLLLQRERIRACFATLLRYAMAVLPHGGTMTMLVEYDGKTRFAKIMTSIQGARCIAQPTFHHAGIRRAVVERHAGAFDFAPERNGVTLTLTLPDRAGRTLDEWIPGFGVFSGQSQQMLRLLKSGGPAPPQDFLLNGILETELERWLLPGFSSSAAENIAHQLPEANPDLPGSSAPRLEKALGQIRRGKPRKEITAPPYAAEVLWAFRRSERHRKAIGVERLDEDAVKQLCLALMDYPPDYVTSLRLIARALTDSE